MKIKLLLGLFALAVSFSALAFHCPEEMKKIDEALAMNPQLTEEQLAEVKEYRAKGEELHSAGQHQEALDTLAKAQEILGIEVKMDEKKM